MRTVQEEPSFGACIKLLFQNADVLVSERHRTYLISRARLHSLALQYVVCEGLASAEGYMGPRILLVTSTAHNDKLSAVWKNRTFMSTIVLDRRRLCACYVPCIIS